MVLAGMVVVADLGTAVVLVLTGVVMFYVAGLERRYLVAAAAEGLGWPWAFGYVLSKGYLSYLLALGLVCIGVGLSHRTTAGATQPPG